MIIKILKLLLFMRRLLYKMTKPTTKGVRMMLIREGEILLVKHSYQDQWYLPGGKVKKKETYEQAIHRELKEELDAEVFDMKLFGVYNNFYEFKDDTVVLFIGHHFHVKGNKNLEIKEHQMFSLNDLPVSTSIGTKKRIEAFLNDSDKNYGEW